MAKLTYNLERLERCIFSLYDDIKSPDDILKTWDIDEDGIDKAWGELSAGKALIGGSPESRIRMLDCWKWEHIFDPPLDDDYRPLWEEAEDESKDIIDGGDDLCSLLLIFAIEGGDPSQYIVDDPDLRPEFCRD